jgi:hypothetical protein
MQVYNLLEKNLGHQLECWNQILLQSEFLLSAIANMLQNITLVISVSSYFLGKLNS